MEPGSPGSQTIQGKGNSDFIPLLPCGHIQNMVKAMEVNPDRKTRVEPQRRLVVNTDNFSATPATKLGPIVFLWILLVWLREVGSNCLGSALFPCIITSLGERKNLSSNHLLPYRPCLFNFWKEGQGNLNISGIKGTGKPLQYFALNVTINHNSEMEGNGDHHNKMHWINVWIRGPKSFCCYSFSMNVINCSL